MQKDFFLLLIDFLTAYHHNCNMLKKVCKVKLFIVLSVFFLSGAFCYARPSMEFTIDYNCLTECSSNVEFTGNGVFITRDEGSMKKKITSPAGIGGSATVLLGSPIKSLELGIGSSVSYNVFSNCMLDDEKAKVDSGYVLSFAAGPAARVSFGKYTSLYFSPGVRFNIQNISIKNSIGKMTYQEKNIMFNISGGIREWFFSTGKTNFGLDAGFDFAFPMNSFCKMEYSGLGSSFTENYKVKSGRFLKFYVGMCLNFGNRNTN